MTIALSIVALGVAIASIIYANNAIHSLMSRIKALEKHVGDLSQGAVRLDTPDQKVDATTLAEPEASQLPPEPDRAAPVLVPDLAQPATINSPPGRSEFWSRAERWFARYWTGILGAIALVVGFSFLAILTALRMSELPRFLMLVAVSGLLYVGSVLLARRHSTGLLGSWLRSAAGALFLFGCLGSTAVPWLRWVNSPAQGYALLGLGIAVNLYFALSGKGELFASFHTLISLAALAVAPADGPAMAVAVIVTGACSVPAYKRPWGLHLLLTVTTFFAFFVAWMLNQATLESGVAAMALAGLLAAFAPGFGAPYYNARQKTDRLGLAARGAMWLYFAAAVLAFSGDLPWIPWVVLFVGGAGYLLSRIATARTPQWLPSLDGIAAVVLALVAATGLIRLELDLLLAAGMAYLVCVLISLDRKGYAVVRRFAGIIQALLGVGLIIAAIGPGLLGNIRTMEQIQTGGVMLILSIATFAQLRINPDRPGWVRVVLGALFPAFLGALYFVGLQLPVVPKWMAAGGLLILIPAAAGVLVDRREPSLSSRIGLLAVVVLAHGGSLFFGDAIAGLTFGPRLAHVLLLLALATVAVLAATPLVDGRRRVPIWPGVFLLVIDLAAAAVSLTPPMDDSWIMGLWLIISAALYPLAAVLRAKSIADARRHLRTAAISLTLFAGLITAVLSGGSSPRIRYVVEVLVVVVLLVWSRGFRDDRGRTSRVHRSAALIGSLVVACLYVVLEIEGDYAAIALALISVGALLTGARGPSHLRPLAVFSSFSYFIALVAFPFFTGPTFHDGLSILSKPWWTGLGAALATLLYVALFYIVSDLEHLDIPDESARMRRYRLGLVRWRTRILFVPYFVAVGIYFVWSFSGPALTALFIIESFAIFALGIALKEKIFRPFAYGLVGFCLVRLVFFDMARADTLERALVFIIAGAVLLGMNALYNRFAEDKRER